MTSLIKAIRGMNDILPDQSARWQLVESILRRVVRSYSYHEIRFPVLEQTALFKRSIGDVTDIIEKEMYSFQDRNGDELSLRPEGTACCARAALEHGLLYHQTQRLWYMGAFYRHERPQKGRYRQFHQLGIESFGVPSPDMDAEVIALSSDIFKALGLRDKLKLHINSIGAVASRQAYRLALIDYFKPHQADLDDDSLRRLKTNPLRLLDSKDRAIQLLIQQAPKLVDFLEEHSQQHFDDVLSYLDALGISYTVDPYIVRGLDYYNDTVFEWVADDGLGAQSTVCAGGRYDGLVSQLGGASTPAFGFGLGIERLLLLLEAQDFFQQPVSSADVYIIVAIDRAKINASVLANTLRQLLPQVRIALHCGEGSLKSQFKKADKSHARFALVLGEEELQHNKITLKYLRENGEQRCVSLDELVSILKDYF